MTLCEGSPQVVAVASVHESRVPCVFDTSPCNSSLSCANDMNRYKASGMHLVLSVGIGLSLFWLFWFVWYPAPMLIAIGGHELFLLIVGVDAILGPLLTLVVFNTKKRSLKFDLLVVAAIQIGALVYGVSVMLKARPVFVAALGGHFQVVQATEVTDDNLKKANATLPLFGPVLVGTKAPVGRYDTDAVELVQQIGGGRGHFPQLHVPYESMASEVLEKSKPISALIASNPQKADEITAWLRKHDLDANTARFQPIRIRASEFVVVIDAKTAAVAGIAPFKQ